MGKGDNRRPTQTEDKDFQRRWEKAFGKKAKDPSKEKDAC